MPDSALSHPCIKKVTHQTVACLGFGTGNHCCEVYKHSVDWSALQISSFQALFLLFLVNDLDFLLHVEPLGGKTSDIP